MALNLELLKARAADVEGAVKKIQAYTSLVDNEFWSDERNLLAVKYLLLQAMEAVGSICVHVLAKEFELPSSSYAGCFERLAEKGVLAPELSDKLRKMSRFRNIPVHRYWDVDDRRVVEYARTDIQDFTEMLKSIWSFLGFGINPADRE